MAGIEVDIIGLDTALSSLQELSLKAPSATEQGIRRVALLLRDNFVMFAQIGHPEHPNVITGRLSGSMKVSYDGAGNSIKASIGSDAEYAPYVEFGHMSRSWGSQKWHHVPPYPWFRPGIMNTFDSGDAQLLFENTIKEVLGF